jgi:hypothetical protein
MLHTINVVERVLTLVVICLLLFSYAARRYCERSLDLVLFYIGGLGVCAAIWYLLLVMFQILDYMYRYLCR